MNSGTWHSDHFKAYYGLCLIEGCGVEKDVSRGKAIILDSTKSGSGISWHALVRIYHHGLGVKRNVARARDYYKRAIICTGGMRGVVAANVALGEMLETGDGVTLNTRRACEYYLFAAKRLNQTAQWKVANAFETGNGRTKHLGQAIYYFNLCAKSGHRGAQSKSLE